MCSPRLDQDLRAAEARRLPFQDCLLAQILTRLPNRIVPRRGKNYVMDRADRDSSDPIRVPLENRGLKLVVRVLSPPNFGLKELSDGGHGCGHHQKLEAAKVNINRA